MKALIIAIALLPLAAAAEYKYDARTGSLYLATPDAVADGGGVHVHGATAPGGMSWSTTVEQNGAVQGYDSSGNAWNYANPRDGALGGTEHGCIGNGVARRCW